MSLFAIAGIGVTYFLALCALVLACHRRGKRSIVFTLGVLLLASHLPFLVLLFASLTPMTAALLAGPAVLALCAMGLSLIIPRQRFPYRRSVLKIHNVGELWQRQVQRNQPFVLEQRRAA